MQAPTSERLLHTALQHVLRLNAYAGMGMTTTELAARYREYGAKCLLLAQSQDDREKLVLIDMAQAWIALAVQAEKNEALFVLYETPARPAGGL